MKKISQRKLKEAKAELSCLIFDYDGTLFDRFDNNFNHNRARRLLLKALNKYHVAVITARSASALKIIAKPILSAVSKKQLRHRFFLGVGDGITLYEIKKNRLKKIYSYELSFSEIKYILSVYKEIKKKLGLMAKDFIPEGLKTFSKFILEDWKEYITKNVIELNKRWAGLIFADEAKISIVKPLELGKERQLIRELKKALQHDFNLMIGDIDIHIIKKLSEDSKKKAAKTVIKCLNITSKNIITYLNKPPYLLLNGKNSPVKNVHEAVDFLIKS